MHQRRHHRAGVARLEGSKAGVEVSTNGCHRHAARHRHATTPSFRVALDYAVLAPGAAFDNPTTGATARAAQVVRLRLGFHY